nr:DUF3795 domain-containing protein [Candidatus Njordarchaeum guaymaensis]
MNYEAEKNRFISYCGSYCKLCDWFTGKIRRASKTTLDLVQDRSVLKRQLEQKGVDFKNLTKGLVTLTESNICPSCKAEVRKERNAEDRCKIRQCCSAKGFTLCSDCEEFPCEALTNNPGVIKYHCVENLKEIREKGLEQWIDKQWKQYAKST